MSDEWEDVAPAGKQPSSDDGWSDVAPDASKSAANMAEADRLRRVAAESGDSPLWKMAAPFTEAYAGFAGRHFPKGLERVEGESTLDAIRKGGTTAVVQGLADIPGVVGNMRSFNEYVSDRIVPPVTAGAMNAVRGFTGQDPVTSDDIRAAKMRVDRDTPVAPALDVLFPTGDRIASPVLERFGKYEPESMSGKLAQGAVRAGVGGVAPMGFAGRAAPGSERVLVEGSKAAGELLSPGMVAANMGSSAAGEMATEATGDPLAGAAFGVVAPAAAGKAARVGAWAVAPALESIPVVGQYARGTRERLAAEELYRRSSNPEALRDWVNGNGQAEGLENFPLTTGQATGDVGLLARERAVRTANEDFATDMMELAGRQTGALHSAAKGMTGETADPMAVTDAFTSRHNEITSRYQATEDALRARAQEAAAALGLESADAGAVGAQLREAIAANQERLRGELNELYDKVNPNRDMRVLIDQDMPGEGGKPGAPSLRTVADEIHKTRRQADRFSPGLNETLDIARHAPSVWDFEELRGLDERLTKEMNDAREDNVSYPRLARLKTAVKNTITNAAANQVAWMRANGLPVDPALEGRTRRSHDDFASPGDAPAGVREGAARTGTDPAGAMAVRSVPGEEGAARVGSGNADRGAGLAQEAARERTLYYPGGNSIKARPELAELDDLLISHGDDFAENPNYPQAMQPRNRDNAAAQSQVNRYAGSEWNPERYGLTDDANSGAPVVGPDNVVESGNGRTMAIRRRYDQGDASYRNWLESQGYDTTGMRRPVLVARRTTQFPDEAARQQYVNLVNRESGLGLGVREEAASDTRFITPEDIYKVKEGPLHSEANQNFMRAFLSRLTGGEQARLIDERGLVTQRGIERAKAALAQKAYESDALLGRAFEINDNDAKSITNALTEAAGPWAKMRQAVADGTIDASHDITGELMRGVEKIFLAREKGMPVANILDQIDAFDAPITRDAYALLFDGEKVASQAKLTARLNKYAADAIRNESGGFGFGETRPVSEILSGAMREGEEAAASSPAATKAAERPKTGDGVTIPLDRRPNIGPEQADALDAANKKFGKVAEIMRPAQGMLTQRMGGNYMQRDSAIPASVIVKGDQGYQKATEFLRAADNKPQAIEAMKEMVLNRFRSIINRQTGVVDPRRWSALQTDYAGAVRAIERVSPGFEASLQNPRATADALISYERERKASLDALQKEEAARFLGKETPEEVSNAIAEIINGRNPSVAKIRKMVETLKGENPAALEGLQKAMVDWIVRKDTNATKTVNDQDVFSYAKLNNLLKEKSHVLAEIMSPEQMNTLRAMRDSMAQMNRSSDRTKIPGSPNSARDMKSHFETIGKEFAEKSYYAVLVDAWLRGEGGFDKVARTMGVAALGGLFKLRALGIDTIGDLEREMLLNPDVAKAALKRVKQDQLPQRGDALMRAVRRAYLNQGVDQERMERASGGRLARASGGRMGRGHPLTVNQIISGIERARRSEQQRTESILRKPDEAVVRALSIANQNL